MLSDSQIGPLATIAKPTQIYRYLRNRHLSSPIFLHRTLSYMRHRMSRSHKGRKNFKVDSIYLRVAAKTDDDTSERKIQNLSIDCVGVFSKKFDKKIRANSELSSVKICHKRRNGPHSHHKNTKANGAITYRFLHGEVVLQQTKSSQDLKCPWCSLKCKVVMSLMHHLKNCHMRFNFSLIPDPKGYKINVTVNENFDGSYTGNPYDLSHPAIDHGRRNDRLHSVKRALFIDGNLLEHHRKTFEFLKKEMTKIEDEQRAKYNFDFKSEKPLDGNYDWVKIRNSGSAISTK